MEANLIFRVTFICESSRKFVNLLVPSRAYHDVYADTFLLDTSSDFHFTVYFGWIHSNVYSRRLCLIEFLLFLSFKTVKKSKRQMRWLHAHVVNESILCFKPLKRTMKYFWRIKLYWWSFGNITIQDQMYWFNGYRVPFIFGQQLKHCLMLHDTLAVVASFYTKRG